MIRDREAAKILFRNLIALAVEEASEEAFGTKRGAIVKSDFERIMVFSDTQFEEVATRLGHEFVESDIIIDGNKVIIPEAIRQAGMQ